MFAVYHLIGSTFRYLIYYCAYRRLHYLKRAALTYVKSAAIVIIVPIVHRYGLIACGNISYNSSYWRRNYGIPGTGWCVIHAIVVIILLIIYR